MSEKVCYNDKFLNKMNEKNEVIMVEEYANIPDFLEEENESCLIRVEMNVIEFPIFSKDKTIKKNVIKKYHFSEKKESYLIVTPAAQDTIPGAFEEKVFLALLKIFKEQGQNQTFYCRASDILEILGFSEAMKGKSYTRLKKAIMKLSMTSYTFSNLFYDNEEGKALESVLTTTLISHWLLTFKTSSNEEKELFSDKRTKEIYKITFSEEIYKNLKTKGYLVFDYEELLNIKDPVTRAIYTQITKLRNSKLFLERPASFIAKRIPLSWKSYSIKRTVLKIESSLEELKELGYISGFEKKVLRKIEETKFQIYFTEEHNKIKQSNFFIDRNESYIHTVEESKVLEIELLEPHKEEQLNKILEIFGEKGKGLKTLSHAIKEALKEHDFYYVQYAAEYTMTYSKQSLLKYFKDTLKNSWHEEYMSKETAKEKRKQNAKAKEQEKKEIEEVEIIEESKPAFTKTDFENLPKEYQVELEDKAYREFLKETGSKKGDKTMKKIFEKSKMSQILLLQDDIERFKIIASEKMDILAFLENPMNEEHEEKEKQLEEMSCKEYSEYISLSAFTFLFYKKVSEIFEDIKIDEVGSMLKMFGEFEYKGSKASYDNEKKVGKYCIKLD